MAIWVKAYKRTSIRGRTVMVGAASRASRSKYPGQSITPKQRVKRLTAVRERVFSRTMKAGISPKRSGQLQSTYKKLGNKIFDVKMGNRFKIF